MEEGVVGVERELVQLLLLLCKITDNHSIINHIYEFFQHTQGTINMFICDKSNTLKAQSTCCKDFKVDIVSLEIIKQQLFFTFLGLDIIAISSA